MKLHFLIGSSDVFSVNTLEGLFSVHHALGIKL